MSVLTALLSPLTLLFLIIFVGLAIGQIRIKQISLGIAGILFAAMLVGVLMNLWISTENTEIISSAQSTMKVFSSLGTSLFVSVIGLQTGLSLKNKSKESIIAFIIGSLMSLSGVMMTLLISLWDKAIRFPTLLGVLCGALTSTPGLSCVCELTTVGSEDAVWGYGASYLLGVIFVVFFAQFFSKKTSKNQAQAKPSKVMKSKAYSELTLICVIALLGNILGNIRIAFLPISFGTTASTLISGVLLGYIASRTRESKQVSLHCLNAFRSIGLALFFTGTGFTTGIKTVSFDIKPVLYGALITLIAIFCGWLLCVAFSAKHHLHRGFIIAGGMTSSPAYGAISYDTNEASVNCFSFAYFGALITLIIALQIIVR